MNLTRLAGVDLNLMVALDALLAERSVTRAARRVGLSQPAMSNTLGRLRRLLGDPVLVRTATGMAPTRRALELAEPVHRALADLERALAPEPGFDPASARLRFRLSAADYVEFVLLPPLLERLAREAPGIDVETRAWEDGLFEELRAGRVDLLLGAWDELPPWLDARVVLEEDFVCVVRRGNPRVGRRLGLRRYAELDHVLPAPFRRPGGLIDDRLAERGLARRVAVRTPHFLMAPVLVAQSDMVCTLGRRVAERFARWLPLALYPVPVGDLRVPIRMVWHRRSEADAPLVWLRSLLAEVAAGL